MSGQQHAWKLAEVQSPHRAVIEMELEGAIVRFAWTFEELEDARTRLTQHITLEGPSADHYSSEMEAGFARNIGPGMERLARDMARHGEAG